MFEPVRGGTRGGQAEFKWSDVSADKDREVRPHFPLHKRTLHTCMTDPTKCVLELPGAQHQRADGTVAEEQGRPLVLAGQQRGRRGAEARGDTEDQGAGGRGVGCCLVRVATRTRCSLLIAAIAEGLPLARNPASRPRLAGQRRARTP